MKNNDFSMGSLGKNNSIKRAAVYDRWFNALGGGEQVAFAYAIALRDLNYKTELLVHRKLDIQAAERKMNVDLAGIEIKYIPNLPDFKLSQYTEGYDVFVSNSYLDYIPNRSKYGILSIFFPSKIYLSYYEYFKRVFILPSLRNFFIYPSRYEGFKYDEKVGRMIYKWLGNQSTITINQNIKFFKIELYFEYLSFSCLDRIKFFWGKEEIKFSERTVLSFRNKVVYQFEFKKCTEDYDFTIVLPDSEFSKNIALTRVIIPNYRYLLYNFFKQLFPKLEMRLHGGPSFTKYSDIESYNKIITISNFSQKWITHYWGVQSEVLYPSVSITDFYSSKNKKNIITNIGRFFVTGHSKKQLDMVRVFKEIVDKGTKDWELHFIGSVADGETHQRYFEMVKEEALNYPIFFHENSPFKELREILSKSKIYWHATGLDENADENPIKLEHFGITTVEAMASGCVPVVINLGGQSEIVTDDCGFKWNTREELQEYTIRLINDNRLLSNMRKNAIERSRFFSRENFVRELKKYLPVS